MRNLQFVAVAASVTTCALAATASNLLLIFTIRGLATLRTVRYLYSLGGLRFPLCELVPFLFRQRCCSCRASMWGGKLPCSTMSAQVTAPNTSWESSGVPERVMSATSRL